MHTYTQAVKEQSRKEIWRHAIRSLTTKRKQVQIIQEDIVRDAWDYVVNKSKYTKNYFESLDIDILNSWVSYSEQIYGSRRADELSIVYLCGPEPENDLDIMVSLGVKIENVWAIESETESYKSAINHARVKYPNLKIFHGDIKDFFEIYNYEFDIIYLDFVSPVFAKEKSPVNVIHSIFDEGNLSNLGILITNYPLSDTCDEYVEYMKDFFIDNRHLDGSVIGIKTDKGEDIDWFADGAECLGYWEERMIEAIRKNFASAYSALCSLYPIYYANIVAPRYRIVNKNSTFKMFFQDDSIAEKILKGAIGAEMFPEFGFAHRVSKLTKGKIKSSYCDKEKGKKYSRYDAVKLTTVLSNFECFRAEDLFSESLLASLKSMYSAIEVNEKNRISCDALLHNDIIELMFNQLGMISHVNMDNQKRFQYVAKTRNMFVDIITVDKCKSFYDWMPLFELYEKSMINEERQLLFRCCFDFIGKKIAHTPIPVYDGGVSLIGIGETEWAKFTDRLPERFTIQ